jgi:Sensors of blue-light using FAD
MVFHLLYISHVEKHWEYHELLSLLKISRANNTRKSITGILIYDDRIFIQLLEGERDAVIETMERVRKDPRHDRILHLVAEENPSGRMFPGWTMGFRHMRFLDDIHIPGLEQRGLEEIREKLAMKKESIAARIIGTIISGDGL